MKKIFIIALSAAVGGLVAFGAWLLPGQLNFKIASSDPMDPMGLAITAGLAEFTDSLASPITASSTSITLTRGTDSNTGSSLSGTYIFKIDSEYMEATCTGTACTLGTRGLSTEDLETHVYALTKAHGRGAAVKVTDAYIVRLARIMNGDETVPNKLTYASAPTLTADADIATKKYADDLAIAGAPDMTATVKGICEKASGAEAAASTLAGDTTAPLCLTTGISTSTPYTTGNYIVVSDTDGKLNQSWLDLTENYSWSGQHTFTATTVQTGVISGKDYDWSFFTAGEAIATASSVYLNADGKVYNAGIAAPGTGAYRFIGFALSAAAANENVFVKRGGLVGGFASLTGGSPVYLSSTGTISHTPNATYTVKVGYAKDADEIFMLPRKLIMVGNPTITSPNSTTATIGFIPSAVRINAICDADAAVGTHTTAHMTCVYDGDTLPTCYGVSLSFKGDAAGSDNVASGNTIPMTCAATAHTLAVRFVSNSVEFQWTGGTDDVRFDYEIEE